MKFFDRYQAWLHLIGWVVFISLPFLTLPDLFVNRQDLISISMLQVLTNTLIITFFYINLRLLTPKLLQNQQSGRFFGILLFMLVSVAAARLIAFYLWPPAVMPEPHSLSVPSTSHLAKMRPFNPWAGVLSSCISFGFAMLVSSLMALFRYHTRSQEAQQQMMLEKVSAELAVLKLQVSPHFLFNTLNNIRWLARQKSDQTEAAVVTLAQLLRYMIYQARKDKVPLRQEVQHLQDYIDLQTMRLTSQHTVTFRSEGDIDAYDIEPLLFIPFVENAFKYGVHSQKPSHIRIELIVANQTLSFITENPTSEVTDRKNMTLLGGTPMNNVEQEMASETSSGIGVINVQKRLALHYADQHTLTLTNENGLFRVHLTLDLSRTRIQNKG